MIALHVKVTNGYPISRMGQEESKVGASYETKKAREVSMRTNTKTIGVVAQAGIAEHVDPEEANRSTGDITE